MLDPQESPDEIKRREVELGSESWTSFASVVTQQRSNGHCPCDCSAHQLKQQLRSTLVAARWPNHSLFFSPFHPHFPHLSPSLISHLSSVDVKQHVYTYLRV